MKIIVLAALELLLCAASVMAQPVGMPPLAGVVSAGGACTNQLVLDYSNSCALIGQAWGQ